MSIADRPAAGRCGAFTLDPGNEALRKVTSISDDDIIARRVLDIRTFGLERHHPLRICPFS